MTEPLPPVRPSIWDLLRWLLVLPAAVMAYILVTSVLVQAAGTFHLPLAGSPAYVLIFSLGALAGVSAGAWTAPGYRFPAACGLTVLLALALAYVVIGLALNRTSAPSVLRAALGQLVAALFVVYLLWRAERSASSEFR